jgi:hypothetical protein
MGDFALIKRKTSAYLPRNGLHSAFNRKISAYFTFAGYTIKDETSYLKGVGFISKIQESHALMHYAEVLYK